MLYILFTEIYLYAELYKKGREWKSFILLCCIFRIFFPKLFIKIIQFSISECTQNKRKGFDAWKKIFVPSLKKLAHKKKYLSATERENFSFYYFFQLIKEKVQVILLGRKKMKSFSLPRTENYPFKKKIFFCAYSVPTRGFISRGNFIARRTLKIFRKVYCKNY